MQATKPKRWLARASFQILSTNTSYSVYLSDKIARQPSARLKWWPWESVTHQAQVQLIDQLRKNSTTSGAHRPSVALDVASTPEFFCIRHKRLPFRQSGSSVVLDCSRERQRCDLREPGVQPASIQEAGQQ